MRQTLLRAISGWHAARSDVAVLFPALALGAFWLGGETALVAVALVVPVIWIVLLQGVAKQPSDSRESGFGGAADLVSFLDPILSDMPVTSRVTACFVVAFDDPAHQFGGHAPDVRSLVGLRTAERISAVVRSGDLVVRLADGSIAVGLAAVRRFDLETAIQMSTRLRAACVVPVAVDDLTFHPSVSVGFCLAERAPAPVGRALLDAAQVAADEALLNGPGALRAFQPDMARRRADRAELRAGLEQALDEGQIRPWFQPQICADTAQVSGVEALARWHHPVRGIISPADFLPVVEDAGLSARLGEVILHGALSALSRWDHSGLSVPRMSVNLSAVELRRPGLADRLAWELDRFGLTPDRLTIEVLETVASGAQDEVVVANLTALSRQGFGIDLDDFGTGQTSIASIRRFSIRRVKIDRCFVTRADVDPEQKRVVAAILTLCEQLGLETVAEGVETPGEHATMAQLGCTHLQGFGIARPMAMEETFGWLERRMVMPQTVQKPVRKGRA